MQRAELFGNPSWTALEQFGTTERPPDLRLSASLVPRPIESATRATSVHGRPRIAILIPAMTDIADLA